MDFDGSLVARIDSAALLDGLNAVFEQDPDLDEVGILLGDNVFYRDDGKNFSVFATLKPGPESVKPLVVFLSREHKLGVAHWCLPLLYRHASKTLNTLRNSLNSTAIALPQQTALPKVDATLRVQLLEATRAMLLINPDCNDAWIVRKRVATQLTPDSQDRLRWMLKEVQFLDLLFSKHPKCGDAWAHRRWVLEHIFQEDSNASSSMFSHEIRVCERAAVLYPRNYYSWTHRHWLCERLSTFESLSSELVSSKKWTDRNISDHCGFQHRQVVLLRMARVSPFHSAMVSRPLSRNSDFLKLTPLSSDPALTLTAEHCKVCETFAAEFRYLDSLIDFYPGHETLWAHRRFVFGIYLRLILQHSLSARNTETVPSSPHRERVTAYGLVGRELQFAQNSIWDDGVEDFAEQKRWSLQYRLRIATTLLDLAEALSFEEASDQPLYPEDNDDADTLPASTLALKDKDTLNRFVASCTDEIARLWPVNAHVWMADTPASLQVRDKKLELSASQPSEFARENIPRTGMRAHQDG